jgi:hypothetical protein
MIVGFEINSITSTKLPHQRDGWCTNNHRFVTKNPYVSKTLNTYNFQFVFNKLRKQAMNNNKFCNIADDSFHNV